MTAPFDRPTVHRLLWHEAQVHAVPDRDLRDLGDAILLTDPLDPEPFWNRLEALRLPADADAFDQRLMEIRVLFASLGRQPHIWLLPPYDEPADVYDRLVAHGYEDAGPGQLMVTTDATATRRALASMADPRIGLERFSGLRGPAAQVAATMIASVLLPAFGVGARRQPGVLAETLASLGDPRFTHYVARLDDVPAAVARRATFDGLSYLSSIGTVPDARGHGLGRTITAQATVDGFAAGSDLVHLGVFADNAPARAMYERLGFAYVGRPGPDMLLIG